MLLRDSSGCSARGGQDGRRSSDVVASTYTSSHSPTRPEA